MNFSNAVSAAYSAWSVLSFILAVIGALSLVVLAMGAISRLGKAAWRFGLALYGKKIMIISDGDDYHDLEEDLSSSGLIKKKNVLHISNKQLSKAKNALLLIVVYDYLNNSDFQNVIRNKSTRCGLIVHCPPEKGRIAAEEMELLSKSTFTALCNFRGRLVNDVLLMMLSTSFKKKDMK